MRSVSLFRGAVTVGVVRTRLHHGVRISSTTRGVRANGTTIAPTARRVHLHRWGVLTLHRPRAALAIRLLRPRAGLPAGAVLLVAFAAPRRPKARERSLSFQHVVASARPHRRRRHRRAGAHRPLGVTPPLGESRYTFPVVGAATFGDSYGAFRADVAGNWHHGDDIFARLGTPVVAVADGTLNRVGWEAIGGWRLWVRDPKRNEFYYAHLSGYSPLALHATRVKAGEVIGFVGNTGDAFTTAPHLHFEVHPHQLLSLRYDGAVDPTTYLEHWHHVDHVAPPKPTLPAMPDGEVGREARFVFSKLLAARGFKVHAASRRPRIRPTASDQPPHSSAAAAQRRSPSADASISAARLTLVAGLATVFVAFVAAVSVRVARR